MGSYSVNKKTTVSLFIGSPISGETEREKNRSFPEVELETPGILAGCGMKYLILNGRKALPILSTGLDFSIVSANVKEETTHDFKNFTAADLRLSLIVGKAFFNKIITPYVGGRVFAGPVFFTAKNSNHNFQATDQNKYNLLAGLIITVKNISLIGEYVFLGERIISAGCSVQF